MTARLRSAAYYVGLMALAFFVPGADLLGGDRDGTSSSDERLAPAHSDPPCNPGLGMAHWPSSAPSDLLNPPCSPAEEVERPLPVTGTSDQ